MQEQKYSELCSEIVSGLREIEKTNEQLENLGFFPKSENPRCSDTIAKFIENRNNHLKNVTKCKCRICKAEIERNDNMNDQKWIESVNEFSYNHMHYK